MKFFIKSFFAFICGIILILLFYYYFSLPIVPCLSIYAVSELFLNEKEKITKTRSYIRITFIIVATLFALFCYGGNIFMSIKYYPKFLNWFGILLNIITFIAFIGANNMNILVYKLNIKHN